jgi:hypothetical protein
MEYANFLASFLAGPLGQNRFQSLRRGVLEILGRLLCANSTPVQEHQQRHRQALKTSSPAGELIFSSKNERLRFSSLCQQQNGAGAFIGGELKSTGLHIVDFEIQIPRLWFRNV